jgi:hypothetical protein
MPAMRGPNEQQPGRWRAFVTPPALMAAMTAVAVAGVAVLASVPAIPAQAQTASAPQPGEGVIMASARFGPGGALINGGLHWRIFPDRPDQAGGFRLLKEDRAAQPSIALPTGGYIVHVTFGHASASKTVQVRGEPIREVFDIPAGGITIKGQVGNARIPTGQISYDIYKGSQFEIGAEDRRPLASNVLTGSVVLVPEGTYYIVSKYGDGNAVVRSDIRVQAGRLTDISVTHRAAAIMFRLVGRRGGEALATGTLASECSRTL